MADLFTLWLQPAGPKFASSVASMLLSCVVAGAWLTRCDQINGERRRAEGEAEFGSTGHHGFSNRMAESISRLAPRAM
jgi:hypothetical protein